MKKVNRKLTPMQKLAAKAKELLKDKPAQDITKEDFNKAIKKSFKPKGRATK